jgi:hypothetical protein
MCTPYSCTIRITRYEHCELHGIKKGNHGVCGGSDTRHGVKIPVSRSIHRRFFFTRFDSFLDRARGVERSRFLLTRTRDGPTSSAWDTLTGGLVRIDLGSPTTLSCSSRCRLVLRSIGQIPRFSANLGLVGRRGVASTCSPAASYSTSSYVHAQPPKPNAGLIGFASLCLGEACMCVPVLRTSVCFVCTPASCMQAFWEITRTRTARFRAYWRLTMQSWLPCLCFTDQFPLVFSNPTV